MKKRILYIAGFIILTFIEVLIALYVHDSFVRPYLGDVLVIWVLYCLVRAFIPNGMRRLPLYLFLMGIAAEVLQYFKLVRLLGLEGNPFLRILLGSTFDFKDIACYGTGCCLIAIFEKLMKRRNSV